MKVFVILLVLIGLFTSSVFAFELSYTNYFSNPEFKIYKTQESTYEFSIPYKISNAEIDNIDIDCESTEIIVYFDKVGKNGNFVINIPRALLDMKINDKDDDFIVIIDQLETEYKETDTEIDSRTLNIPLRANSKVLEITATNVGMFPEPIPCGVVSGESPYYRLLSPLEQFNSDISFNEIQCKQNLVLIQKYDGTPACVTEPTKQKLIERGWASYSTTVIIYSSFEQDRDRVYTDPRNVVIDLGKNNSVKWINNADYIVQVYDYENKSWSTGQIYPSMSDSIRFNSTGYYEFAVESANDRHFGEIIVISDDTNSLPIETRMKMGMAIISNDLGKNPALIGVGIGDVNGGIVIDINQNELEKRDDAQSYYYDMYKEMIPFDVPITIEFSETIQIT